MVKPSFKWNFIHQSNLNFSGLLIRGGLNPPVSRVTNMIIMSNKSQFTVLHFTGSLDLPRLNFSQKNKLYMQTAIDSTQAFHFIGASLKKPGKS